MGPTKPVLTDERAEAIWQERFAEEERAYYADLDRERVWMRRDSDGSEMRILK